MSPVEISFRYSHGSAADTHGDFLTYGGTIAELNFTLLPERSRTLGTFTFTFTFTFTGPALVKISRSARWPLRATTRWPCNALTFSYYASSCASPASTA